MTDSTQPTKDSQLDALKRAIEAIPPRPDEDVPDESNAFEDWLSDWRAYNACLAKAWRTAFEWREGIIQRHTGVFHADALKVWTAERDEGMALIRESLK